MQNGSKSIMNTRQPRPAASFAARSKRWTSSAARPEPVTLKTREETTSGIWRLPPEAKLENTVGQRTIQHAEHYQNRCPRLRKELKPLLTTATASRWNRP